MPQVEIDPQALREAGIATGPPIPAHATRVLPGSPEKLIVMELRAGWCLRADCAGCRQDAVVTAWNEAQANLAAADPDFHPRFQRYAKRPPCKAVEAVFHPGDVTLNLERRRLISEAMAAPNCRNGSNPVKDRKTTNQQGQTNGNAHPQSALG